MPAIPAARPEELRTFHHSLYSPGRIAAQRGALTVTVCLPARECAASVGEIVGVLVALREQGVLDEVLVVDAASRDGTAALAARAGARVVQEAELLPAAGPVLGKGDAMWRALSAIESDLVCFLDADTEGFQERFATGLVGPLVCEPDVAYVKGFYRRPLGSESEGGGRVNHLLARPALALLYPELATVRQPLAGEVAARRELLARLPFVTGYGVEVGMLIDVFRSVGLGAMAQVDLEEHRNPHQPLPALAPMAQTVLATVLDRVRREGRLVSGEEELRAPVERPPLAGVPVA